MQAVEIEVWICVDEQGDSAYGGNAEIAMCKYREELGEPTGAIRLIQVKLEVALPVPVTITSTVPAESTFAALTVK